MLNLCHSCSVMMRAKFSHVLQYDSLFFSDLHDLLSEDQNTGYPLITGGPLSHQSHYRTRLVATAVLSRSTKERMSVRTRRKAL